jgi:hypothetical protein
VIKVSLQRQLTDLGLNDERLELDAFPELIEALQNMFYAQGDRIANQVNRRSTSELEHCSEHRQKRIIAIFILPPKMIISESCFGCQTTCGIDVSMPGLGVYFISLL